RRLSFDTLAFGSGLAATCAILTGVALAFWGAGFWSLFGMEIVRRLVLLTHCVSKAGWRPGLEHRSHHLVEVLRFATKRIENEGLAYIAGNALPRGAVGQFLGAEALGLFDVAKRLLERVREILIGPIGRVTFPAAARLQTDPVRMQRLIEASIRISTWVFWPTVLGLIALAPQFVPLILGPRWEAAVPVFQLLAVAALRAPVYAVNKSVLTATAWLKAITTIHLIRIGLGLALIPIGLQAGVVGVAAALALRQWLIWPVVANYVHRACGLAPRRQLTVLLRAALPSIGMTAMLYAALWWQGGGGAPVADLAVYSVAGGLAYLLLWSLANMHEARHLMGAARSFLQGDRGRMKAQLSEVLQ
ncbi:MAG: oligosaccharide flippase family protein, partial [Pseudomonadota bacterium]